MSSPYLFGLALLISYWLFKYVIKLNMELSLLISALLSSLLAGLAEFQYRWFFALAGVTDILLPVALGVLAVIILDHGGFFAGLLSVVQEKIESSFWQKLTSGLVLIIPGMLTGSFLVSALVIRNNFKSKRGGLFWLLAFIGVLMPPINIYNEILQRAVGAGYGYGGFGGEFISLIIIGIILLLVSSFLYRDSSWQLEMEPGRIQMPISLALIVFLGVELGMRNWGPELLYPQEISFFLLVLVLGLIYSLPGDISGSKTKILSQKELKLIQHRFTEALPYLFLVLITGFIISISAFTGFRGAVLFFLEELQLEHLFLLALVLSLLLSLLSPFIALAILAVPLLHISLEEASLALPLLVTLPAVYNFIKRDGGQEGDLGLVKRLTAKNILVVAVLLIIVWGNLLLAII